ncbi:MAG: hypothetical protein AAGA58_01840 [Verrucomicrobiota bacterium]
MKAVFRGIFCVALLATVSGCALRSQPRPLGRVSEENRNRTIVLDRTDEEISLDERRAARKAKDTRILLPWTWF